MTAVALGGLLAAALGTTLYLSHRYVETITTIKCSDPGWRPDALGLAEFHKVNFTTSDGLELNGRSLPGSNGATIILMGGIGTWNGMLPEASILARHDYGLFLFDWRGCGTSQGKEHTLGYLETLDLLAAVDYLSDKPETGQIGVLGFSLGGAVAIRGAALRPEIGAVVAMGNYHDLEEEIYGAGGENPLLSFILEREIAWLFQQKTGIDFGRDAAPVEMVSEISPRPLFLIYGEDEETLPPASGRILFQAAAEPKEYWILPHVGHGGYLQAEPEKFERQVVTFFNAALLPGGNF